MRRISAAAQENTGRASAASSRQLPHHRQRTLLSAGNYESPLHPWYQLPLAAPKNYYAFQFVELMETHIRKLQRVQDYASLLKISRITLNHSVMAQYGVSATYLLKQRLLAEIKNELCSPTNL